MENTPQFESYIDHASKNYRLNCLRFFDAAGNLFYFSYKTLVAFKPAGKELVCHENDWSTTTGKHLNAIQPDKKKRVDSGTFEQLYKEAFGLNGHVTSKQSAE